MQLLSYSTFGLPPTGFDPNHTFFRSPFLPIYLLASLRALLALYSFATITICYTYLASNTSTNTLKDINIPSYTLTIGSDGIHQSFSFFTYLTFWSLGFYFLFSALHTFVYARTGTTWLHRWPRPLQLAHTIYYSTVTCFPFLVTTVFWGTMYSGPWPTGRFEQWINISVHGLNSLFAVFEIVVPATRAMPVSHLGVLLALLSLYLGLAYLTRLTKGFYVYEWMNPAHGEVSIVLHILGYTGGMVGFFACVWGCLWGKGRWLDVREERERVEKSMVKLENGSEWSV
ncbi:hypothetical protein M011DRAFT_412966 [Sporormia fimetaria CBS 119925]|uniref:FAR-17a/AIG1-like protein n=1 Tax=Sporormia fimetaria CBS 119925 TaxID=1340428 RepID=A0A6A6UWL5_9PLEO|nr:hypothetical protein M011DRAFT_412966 [Sporormia fimetaria CBS 119925]